MINPQNIEESPSGHHHCDELEPEMEDRAQRSIQHFFDNFHLPSPTPMCHSHTSPTSGPIHTTVHVMTPILTNITAAKSRLQRKVISDPYVLFLNPCIFCLRIRCYSNFVNQENHNAKLLAEVAEEAENVNE